MRKESSEKNGNRWTADTVRAMSHTVLFEWHTDVAVRGCFL